MMYDHILVQSFKSTEQRKLAFVSCFLITLSFCVGLTHLRGPLPILNLRMSIGLKMLLVGETNTSHQIVGAKKTNTSATTQTRVKECQVVETSTTNTTKLLCCNLMEARSDFCDMSGDIRVHGSSSRVFFVTSVSVGNRSWSLRPYARKGDKSAMRLVRQWSVKPTREVPQCTKNHSVPAVLFSTGGYATNHFHALSDIIIPLFLTSRKFDRDVKFLVTNKNPMWVSKFGQVLKGLSRFEILDADSGHQVHCFPRITVGLKHHRELTIDPSKSPYSMSEFRKFLRSSYSLKRDVITANVKSSKEKMPKLLIISRKRSRVLTNAGMIADMARGLGFEVMVSEADLKQQRFVEMVNSCDVLVGVHGAGLANLVFLPEGAVVVQVVPLGSMEWVARTYYEEPLKDMKLRYLEYKIGQEESSLVPQYKNDDAVLRDPSIIRKKGWVAFRSIYLDKQNVELDVIRFKTTLVQAFELLQHQHF